MALAGPGLDLIHMGIGRYAADVGDARSDLLRYTLQESRVPVGYGLPEFHNDAQGLAMGRIH